ncbi:MAG: tRNA (adenosine(37)-N6)-dimethylallyltransferase MiaA [Acidimicrobiales bacterium]
MPPPSPAPTVVALVGATASGKSEVALSVARLLGEVPALSATPASTGSTGSTDPPRSPGSRSPGSAEPVGPVGPVELVSVDSMAVYRGMDIGTAKPTRQIRTEVAYHLIDLVDPWEEFTVQQFQRAARQTLADIAGRRHRALLVGGTGLYLRALVDDLTFPGRYPEVAEALRVEVDGSGPEGSEEQRAVLARLHDRLAALDPVAAGRLEPTNRRRLLRALEVTIGSGLPFSTFGPGLERYPPTPVRLLGIARDPRSLDDRITVRFHHLMELGLLDEVRRLATHPGGLSRTARQALGYRELLAHLEHGLPLTDAVEEAVRRTRAFARRQMAWFRRDPRIVWMDPDGDVVGSIVAHLAGVPPDPDLVGDLTATP